MANSFTNKYVKNYCKQTILLQLIVQDVITFFWDAVYNACYVCVKFVQTVRLVFHPPVGVQCRNDQR